MLQIQGTSGLPVGTLGKDKERGGQRLEDMMDQFARRLDELRLVIESGERGGPAPAAVPGEAEGSIREVSPLDQPEAQDEDVLGARPETRFNENRGEGVTGEQ